MKRISVIKIIHQSPKQPILYSMQKLFLFIFLSSLIFSTNAQVITWAGMGQLPADGIYLSDDSFTTITKSSIESSPGLMGTAAGGSTSLGIYSLNNFDGQWGEVLFDFSNPVTDSDGLVSQGAYLQRGDFTFTLGGGAIWTSVTPITIFGPADGYAITGVGTNEMKFTRNDLYTGINDIGHNYDFGISGSFTSVKLRYDSDNATSALFATDLVNITFGTLTVTPVPEPSTMGLLGLGALALLARRKR